MAITIIGRESAAFRHEFNYWKKAIRLVSQAIPYLHKQ